MRVRFGDYLLDSGTRELFRKDALVHLPPKAFRLLELLIENRPRAVSKEDILARVWPETFVSEATLASTISDIRAAIGEGGRGSGFIRTVHGFGYSFRGDAAPAAIPAAAAKPGEWSYRLALADREIALDEGETTLGRDRDVTVWIDDASVSRRHARILVSGTGATLEDLQSKNGTFLGGRKVETAAALSNGDEIRLGSVVMTIRVLPVLGSTATQIAP